ncbi:MAG: RsmE family RNA methyltransferase [Ferruginibacter sp.]
MSLPFFYIEENIPGSSIVLDEDTSKHIVQVLRMENGEQLLLTDGKGNLLTAEITDNNRKRCSVNILKTTSQQPPANNITIAVSLLKNTSRFEWLLEKVTELGVSEIIPLICTRTEKQHFRHDRMKGILVSAMLQSRQTWLPVLYESTKLNEVITSAEQQQKFIAHCEDEKDKMQLVEQSIYGPGSKLILIGPEGDFTKEEIELALQHAFVPVALGNTRLRTETAAVAAAVLLCTQ